MHLTELLPHLDELTEEAVQRWIDAALARAAAMREHDDRLYPPMNDSRALDTARLLRQAWSEWADEAEQILERVHALATPGHTIQGTADLERTTARARAMLKLTPEAIARRRQQAQRGEVRSIEEARRELRREHRG